VSDTVVDHIILHLVEGIFGFHLAVKRFHVRQFMKSFSVENALNLTEDRLNGIVVWRIR
jgi:flagellar assembly factor FliW